MAWPTAVCNMPLPPPAPSVRLTAGRPLRLVLPAPLPTGTAPVWRQAAGQMRLSGRLCVFASSSAKRALL